MLRAGDLIAVGRVLRCDDDAVSEILRSGNDLSICHHLRRLRCHETIRIEIGDGARGIPFRLKELVSRAVGERQSRGSSPLVLGKSCDIVEPKAPAEVRGTFCVLESAAQQHISKRISGG